MTANATSHTTEELSQMSREALVITFGDARRELAQKEFIKEVFINKREQGFAKGYNRKALQADKTVGILASQCSELKTLIEMCKNEAEARKVDGRYTKAA